MELARQAVCEFLDGGLEERYEIEFYASPEMESAAIEGDEALLKMRINSRKAEGKTGKQEKRTGERADPQESEHERQTESQNESASS